MAGGRGGRGNGKGGRGGRGGNTGRRVVQVVSPSQGPRKTAGGAKTLDARFTQLNRRRTEQVQRGTTARYATTMARRTGQSAKKFAAKPVAVAGKGKKSKKVTVAVGKKKVTVAAKKATLQKKKDARKAKGTKTTTAAKKKATPKKAPKKKATPKKKTKPVKPEYKPEEIGRAHV